MLMHEINTRVSDISLLLEKACLFIGELINEEKDENSLDLSDRIESMPEKEFKRLQF